jgi:hypothetical protein
MLEEEEEEQRSRGAEERDPGEMLKRRCEEKRRGETAT